eukprot:TRINITY_DN22940_c0_g1_i1.p1 TRINITY_DN22940_c0_g1~~TRINITY_DN22940_c0_g1_i1.p1  ORF type:complete len:902 (+),score=209.80 TRINITY_DN22940_c0_g1_i1:64-2706(+)
MGTPERSPLSTSSRAVNLARLARCSERAEVVFTPGPTKYDVNPQPFSDRRIPVTFRTTPRFGDSHGSAASAKDKGGAEDGSAASLQDSALRAYAYTQPKTFSATFSSEPRFGWEARRDATPDSMLEVDRAYRATQPKSYAVNFNQATGGTAFPPDPMRLRGTLGPAPGYYSTDWGTIAHTVYKRAGGAISTEPRTMDWTIHQESPGPVYAPNYCSVEPAQSVPCFSPGKGPARSARPGAEGRSGPGPLTYADGLSKALCVLSTFPRSPSPTFSTRPSAADMPLPYSTVNVHNSATMRTAMAGPGGEQQRVQLAQQRLKREEYWKAKLAKRRRERKERLALERASPKTSGPRAAHSPWGPRHQRGADDGGESSPGRRFEDLLAWSDAGEHTTPMRGTARTQEAASEAPAAAAPSPVAGSAQGPPAGASAAPGSGGTAPAKQVRPGTAGRKRPRPVSAPPGGRASTPPRPPLPEPQHSTGSEALRVAHMRGLVAAAELGADVSAVRTAVGKAAAGDGSGEGSRKGSASEGQAPRRSSSQAGQRAEAEELRTQLEAMRAELSAKLHHLELSGMSLSEVVCGTKLDAAELHKAGVLRDACVREAARRAELGDDYKALCWHWPTPQKWLDNVAGPPNLLLRASGVDVAAAEAALLLAPPPGGNQLYREAPEPAAPPPAAPRDSPRGAAGAGGSTTEPGAQGQGQPQSGAAGAAGGRAGSLFGAPFLLSPRLLPGADWAGGGGEGPEYFAPAFVDRRATRQVSSRQSRRRLVDGTRAAPAGPAQRHSRPWAPRSGQRALIWDTAGALRSPLQRVESLRMRAARTLLDQRERPQRAQRQLQQGRKASEAAPAEESLESGPGEGGPVCEKCGLDLGFWPFCPKDGAAH